jgi:sporulation protein YlmC with PRC-barrel domain
MKRSLVTMLICGLPLLPLGVIAAENPARGQTNNSPTKDTIPTRYIILPFPGYDSRQSMSTHTLVDATVKDRQGTYIGTVDNLIMDVKTGKVVSAVLNFPDSDRSVPVPWGSFQVNRTGGKVWLSGKAEDLLPELNPKLTRKQFSPIAKLMKEVETVRDSMPTNYSGTGVGMTPYAHPPQMGETTQDGHSDPGVGLTPYSHSPLSYDDDGDGEY